MVFKVLSLLPFMAQKLDQHYIHKAGRLRFGPGLDGAQWSPDRVVSTLLSGLCQDFRNPLTRVRKCSFWVLNIRYVFLPNTRQNI